MIGKDKERIVIAISKEDKTKLNELAEKDSRSLSNFCALILHNYLASQAQPKKKK